ncbi:MAG: sulfite exporter TauE/SafE family protein [Candidatus Zixiibacteriota bacterium]|nr:MAG: sulfite exporter TauE/SafE family protein [candidate division Zixibacteria bacterium]
MEFPISGVETFWWLPLVVAFGIACLTSIGGLSGAFLILPFQMSVLGFTSPAVTSTSLAYNIFSIPSGVYRYCREKRMVWPLTIATLSGTLPGMFLGAYIRIEYLPDPRLFKPFAGFVLLYLAFRMIRSVFVRTPGANRNAVTSEGFTVKTEEFSIRCIRYLFEGNSYRASSVVIFMLGFVIGVVGGIYGIGGGAILAPLFVAVFRLPVYTVAGATLFGTFATSIAGVGFFMLLSLFYSETQMTIAPDWHLAGLFGIGGAVGMYVGARLQRYLPARLIKVVLSLLLLFVSGKYILVLFQ